MPLGIQLLLALLTGVALGVFIGWLLWRGGRSDTRLENELREQIRQRESELAQLRSQLAETGNARAAAEARRKNCWPSKRFCRKKRWPICATHSRH
jgi:type VI protein secretion system component VasK